MLQRYHLDLDARHLQLIVDLLTNAPAPYRETAPVIESIGAQVEQQNKRMEEGSMPRSLQGRMGVPGASDPLPQAQAQAPDMPPAEPAAAADDDAAGLPDPVRSRGRRPRFDAPERPDRVSGAAA